MLTPVDIQQKKFKMGFGYDKKDVNKFFEEVYDSYAALYRSNAELKEKVITFNDRLQHYKTTEENLQKSLLLAEKNTQEQRSNAEKEAKAMELEARSRAEQIVKQASIDLKNMNIQMDELREQYAAYKSKFAALLKEEFEFLGIKDFDTDSYINPRYTEKAKEDAHAADSSKGSLGSNQGSDISSSANVYGSVLGGEGIDPFHSTNNNTRTVNTSGHRNTQTTNKYSVNNNDDDGISPTLNLFRDSEKTYKEAKMASNARTKEDNIFKNAAASRINPEKSENSADVIDFAAKKSSSETTKSVQFDNRKGSMAANTNSAAYTSATSTSSTSQTASYNTQTANYSATGTSGFMSETINNSTAASSSSTSQSADSTARDSSSSKDEKTSDATIENNLASDSFKRIQEEDDLVGDIVLETTADDIQDKTPDRMKIDDQESIDDDDDDEYFIFT